VTVYGSPETGRERGLRTTEPHCPARLPRTGPAPPLEAKHLIGFGKVSGAYPK
jgi:hypothetical protein